MFLKDPGPAPCVCAALYVSIDKIKEPGDESGARKRRGKKRMLYVFDELQGDWSPALIGSRRIRLSVSFRLEIHARVKSALASRFLGFVL